MNSLRKSTVMEKLSVRRKCPFCGLEPAIPLARHIRAEHGEDILRNAVLEDKKRGASDMEIGDKYGVSFNYLERVITQEYGANISLGTKGRARITHWEPKQFRLEPTSVWSFKNRGNWATHDGHYRGNWSPYIPRNLILRYSKPAEVVLDYFVGGGTTAVEAKLLGRRCIARDINPDALNVTRAHLDFDLPQDANLWQEEFAAHPQISVGDARDLSDIQDESVDLICAHPPYAGIIRYSAKAVEGDLSALSVDEFVAEMRKVARESYRVLKPGRQCAILIGDSRKSKRIVPIGFMTIKTFLDAGFTLREIVIKRQHNCRTTGFWYSNSIRYNFLLLAHEYLPVFEKPARPKGLGEATQLSLLPEREILYPGERIEYVQSERLETTSVWIFPLDRMETETRRNLVGRFGGMSGQVLEIEVGSPILCQPDICYDLLHIRGDRLASSPQDYLETLARTVVDAQAYLAHEGFCAVETRDFRVDGKFLPMGLMVFERLRQPGLDLREIVVVTSAENLPFEPPQSGYLGIAHKYLLIYQKP